MSQDTDGAKSVGMSELRTELSSIIDSVHFGGRRVQVTDHGTPRAVIVSDREYRRLKNRAGEDVEFDE